MKQASVYQTAGSPDRAVERVLPTRIPPGIMLGERSRLSDAWSASTLMIVVPAFTYPEHDLEWEVSHTVARPPTIRNRLGVRKHRVPGETDSPGLFFDVRDDTASNIAHVLQNNLATALHGCEQLGLDPDDQRLSFVMPSRVPGYVVELIECFGFDVIRTDSAVRGRRLSMSPRKYPLRTVGGAALRRRALDCGLVRKDKTGQPVFIPRRGRRAAVNTAELADLAERAGYRVVYPEDLPVAEQVRVIGEASAVCAIHGAALGFAQLRQASVKGAIGECFPHGYVTNWARSTATFTQDAWVGMIGSLCPQVLKGLQGGAAPRAFQDRNFALDPDVFKMLLELLRDGLPAHAHAHIGDIIDRLPGVTPDIPSS